MSDDNKYISKTLNPTISDLHEAKSAVHVRLKPSKQTNKQKTATSRKSRGWAGEGARCKYQIYGYLYISSLPLTQSHILSLPLSLRLSSHHSLSLFLPFTDRLAIQTSAVYQKESLH